MIKSFFRLLVRQMDVQLRMRTFNLFSLGLFFLQPAIFSAVGMILSRAAGNATPDLIYTVLGGGMMGMWSGLVFTSTYDIRTDRREGTLELIVGSPTPLRRVEGIRTFTNSSLDLVSLAAAIIAAVLIFDYSFVKINIRCFGFISFLLILFGLWCMGVFLANFLAWSRLSGIHCGLSGNAHRSSMRIYVSRSAFCPIWMQSISTDLSHPLGVGKPASFHEWQSYQSSDLIIKWLIALGISLVFLLISRWLDGKVHDHIRVTGELHSI